MVEWLQPVEVVDYGGCIFDRYGPTSVLLVA